MNGIDEDVNTSSTGWRQMLPTDLDTVNAIADSVHTTLTERPEVFNEKTSLYPKGCMKLVSGNQTVGYGISHPWTLYSIPPLDAFMIALPNNPDCMHLHDIVIMQEARGNDASGDYIDIIKQLAKESNIHFLALVSVYGTHVLWERHGFKPVDNKELNKKLQSYGNSARYMVYYL